MTPQFFDYWIRERLPELGRSVWLWLRVFEFIIVPVLLVLLAWVVYQLVRLRREEKRDFRQILESAREEKPEINEDWQRALNHLSSANAAEWKLAIIEADKMLDDLVKTMGYQGETMGERLQKAEPSDFKTLQDAWSAHKVRNRIAHEQGYELSERDARQAMASYQRVFEEFNII